MSVTPVYAALLTIVFVALSARVIAIRRSSQISLGDGGNDQLLRRIRAQGNFAEYVPLTLLLMTLIEIQGHSDWTLHMIGASLFAGRLLHAYGVSMRLGKARIAGMALTFTALITGALANLVLASFAARLIAS